MIKILLRNLLFCPHLNLVRPLFSVLLSYYNFRYAKYAFLLLDLERCTYDKLIDVQIFVYICIYIQWNLISWPPPIRLKSKSPKIIIINIIIRGYLSLVTIKFKSLHWSLISGSTIYVYICIISYYYVLQVRTGSVGLIDHGLHYSSSSIDEPSFC